MNSLRLIVTLLMLVFATTPTLAAVCASTVSKGCEQMSGNMAGAGESTMSCPCDQQTPADGHDDTAAMAELCGLAGAAALGHSLKTMPHVTHAVHFPETAVIAVSLNPSPPHKPPKA